MYTNKVLVIGGNFDQVPYILELKKKNYLIYLTDINSSAPGIKYSDKYFQVDYSNIDQIESIMKKINLRPSDKVFTASAQFSHIIASIIAEKLNIAYPKKDTIEMCLDKFLFYKEFIKNNLPVPKFYKISSKQNLEKTLNRFDDTKCFYLKSDMSKNPNYIYKITKKNLNNTNIFWGKDRYLQNHYILQEEFIGKHLRVNIYPGDFMIFDFFSGKINNLEKKIFLELKIIEKLRKFLKEIKLLNWLIKFDIIRSENNWCVLDIGIDPPMRMLNFFKKQNENFYLHYINQYIDNKISYPKF
jgi:hypothetical protein